MGSRYGIVAESPLAAQESTMGRVAVYRYTTLDTNVIEPRIANRWGTREAIEGLKVATIIEHSAIQVDDDVLNENGFTALDFDPTK
jgi:hypothetical protein